MEYRTAVAGCSVLAVVNERGVTHFVAVVGGAPEAADMVKHFLSAKPGSVGRGDTLDGSVMVTRDKGGPVRVEAWSIPAVRLMTSEERADAAVRERDELRERVERISAELEQEKARADAAEALLREQVEKQAEENVKPS